MQKNSIFNTIFYSRELSIGNLAMGGTQPIRVQSMTSTDTNNIQATLDQSIRMIKTGCELVRITTPTLKEVESLKTIQKELRSKGYQTPLIADVHYNPKVAEECAHFVEKVRINPGNYVDRSAANKIEFTEKEYQLELEKIADRLHPLLKICKENGTIIRIGTNHGSLSQRITSRHGDTPHGMVESALEFVKICEAFQFQNIVLSMKSSNLKVMVQAYRLLANKMIEEGMNYPLHLGVTEAGNGMEGRIKSAAGIGTLLEEGLGDTIRVSLTEDPEHEIPVAKTIVQPYNLTRSEEKTETAFFEGINPFEFNRRKTEAIDKIGGDNVPVILAKEKEADFSPDNLESKFENINILESVYSETILNTKSKIHELISNKNLSPLIIKRKYTGLIDEDFIIKSAIDFGSLQIDGLGDGIWIENEDYKESITELSQKILQACGTRISATEYIACPSCGRTKYDIQKAFAAVKQATNHLVGLKIAVMGCVVNGPGEMADAHYGYVGSGNGKVNLYKKRELVKKNIAEENAIEELISLIKENCDWKEAN